VQRDKHIGSGVDSGLHTLVEVVVGFQYLGKMYRCAHGFQLLFNGNGSGAVYLRFGGAGKLSCAKCAGIECAVARIKRYNYPFKRKIGIAG